MRPRLPALLFPGWKGMSALYTTAVDLNAPEGLARIATEDKNALERELQFELHHSGRTQGVRSGTETNPQRIRLRTESAVG